jgi:hypothetical protein
MHDSTLQIMGADVAVTNEGHLQLIFTTAVALPVGMTPTGPQFMPVQDGVYRIPMRKETAIEYAERILAEADTLPDTPTPMQKSDLVIANNMNDVNAVAKQTQQFRDGSRG